MYEDFYSQRKLITASVVSNRPYIVKCVYSYSTLGKKRVKQANVQFTK